ncbi:MAG: DUF134 domain-containing protein [Candidatus Aenigmarchaeota archaeon]|nr:DUF134 domain-containing protein [Candidatus Aenigmarchaeota archaeon]
MARPKKTRMIHSEPEITYFKPARVALRDLRENSLTLEEIEAVRLKDLDGLDQEECAKRMNVSRTTFHRVLGLSRKKIADALLNGKALRIGGGDYMLGRGEKGGRGFGPGGECVCPECGRKVPHDRGIPCFEYKCPDCGTQMTRTSPDKG